MQNEFVGKCVDEKHFDMRSVEESCETGIIDLCDCGTV